MQLVQRKMVNPLLGHPKCTDKIGFTFDRVFDSSTRQEDIFDFGVKTIVEGQLPCLSRSDKADAVDVMTGFNGTLFCYGQTGSGKTYSELSERFHSQSSPDSHDGQLPPG